MMLDLGLCLLCLKVCLLCIFAFPKFLLIMLISWICIMLIIFVNYFKTDKDKVLFDSAFNAAVHPDHIALCACNQTYGALKLSPYFKNV